MTVLTKTLASAAPGTTPNDPGQTPIPLVDLKTQYESLKNEVLPEVEQVFATTQFILGKPVQTFESEFAAYCGAKFCTGVASGTDALHLALRALDIGPGDEVITAANTFIATALAIAYAGATPVLADVDEKTFNLDLKSVEEKITPRTRALLPVHLYGRVLDMEALNTIAAKHGLTVVEDACQAHGARLHGKRAGTFGTMGCFSFYPGKNLGAYGDGGALVTADEKMHAKLERLRNYGSTQKYVHDVLGFNSRLDSVQAAVLNVKLPHLDSWNRARLDKARAYNRELAGVGDLILPEIPEDGSHAFHLYVVRTQRRDALLKFLNGAGIGAGIHYPHPVYAHGAFSGLKVNSEDYPVTEKLSKEILSLPLFPELTDAQLARVAQTVRSFYEQ